MTVFFIDKDEKECMQCPDGWIQYKRSCYMIVEEKLSFDKARVSEIKNLAFFYIFLLIENFFFQQFKCFFFSQVLLWRYFLLNQLIYIQFVRKFCFKR
jgi:hypothetical protein